MKKHPKADVVAMSLPPFLHSVYAMDVCLNITLVQLSRTHSTEEDCVDNIPTH